MAVFSDDPDALEIVIDTPGIGQASGLTLRGQGFLTIGTQVAFGSPSVTFTGQGFLRFPSNERIACDVLVKDESVLQVLVNEEPMHTVLVLVDKDVDE